MPGLFSPKQVKRNLTELVDKGTILQGEALPSETAKNYLLPGARVVRGDCLLEISPLLKSAETRNLSSPKQ